MLFPGSSKVLTNDRWSNVETTADNKSTLDKRKIENNMGMQLFTESKWIQIQKKAKERQDKKLSQKTLEQGYLGRIRTLRDRKGFKEKRETTDDFVMYRFKIYVKHCLCD